MGKPTIENPWATDDPSKGTPQLEAAAKKGIQPGKPGQPVSATIPMFGKPRAFDDDGKEVPFEKSPWAKQSGSKKEKGTR